VTAAPTFTDIQDAQRAIAHPHSRTRVGLPPNMPRGDRWAAKGFRQA